MNTPLDHSYENAAFIKQMAAHLLSLEEGEQLKSTRELADEMQVSVGSISYAVNYLEQIGAAEINRRGRLGSFLEKKAPARLWKIIENAPMIVALTLPSFLKAEGLATAIYSLLDSAGFETYLTYIRGSINRVSALREGRCSAVVMSRLAAEALCTEDEEIILDLPPQSFVTDHRVFFRTQTAHPTRPLRVGIDVDSYDIKTITELEFSHQMVEFVPVPFVQIDLHLEKSAVDAAISNIDHLEHLTGRGISSRPLSPAVLDQLQGRDTCAALVVRAGAGATRQVLQDVLDAGRLLDIQQKVVDGLLVPRY